MRRAATAGFSLLELLVALFVVVLVTSLVTLSVGSGGRDTRLQGQVRTLANVAGYALDEAQLRGVDYGLVLFSRFDRDGEEVFGFGWRERMVQGWRPPQGDAEVFEEQLFDPGIEFRLELEDHPLGELAPEESGDDNTPQVIFYSSGETVPGALELRREPEGELLWRIEWDLLGRFTLLPRGEEVTEDEREFR